MLRAAVHSQAVPARSFIMLQVGFGSADITPSPGMEMPGSFSKRAGKGVLDKCWAVACVVHDGTTPIALVGTDTLIVARETVEAARRQIQKDTKIPGDNVLIGASHTHSGGPCGFGWGREEDPAYLDKLAKGIAAAVSQAFSTLHAAEIGTGVGKEGSISFNRRFLMKDGREITHPGKPGTPHHDEIVKYAGPIDPDVGVLAVRHAEGKIAGIVVNFACHNTVMGGDQFSADYAGQIRKHLKASYGENTPVVFLLGACGDITQVDNLSTAREFGPKHADMMGMKLAAETTRTINRMAWLRDAPTAATRTSVMLALRPDPDVERERPPFGLGSGRDAEGYFEQGRKQVAEFRAKTPKVPAEVQAIRIGPLGIVTNGSEYFCEFALRMKECSPFKTTFVVSLANEWLGYVPTSQAFIAGGYEPRTARSSRLAVDAGQLLMEAGLKSLGKVAPKM
jgi:hypothetical protein